MILPNNPEHVPFLAALMVASDKLGKKLDLHWVRGRRHITVEIDDDRQMMLLGMIIGFYSQKRQAIDNSRILAGAALRKHCRSGSQLALWDNLLGHEYD